MIKALKFVDVGEGITEGHLQKWLVKDGDYVKEDQSLFQIETDKAVVQIPAPISGKVKIIASENAIVHVGDTLAYVGDPAELENAATGAQPAEAQANQEIKTNAAPQQEAQEKEPAAQVLDAARSAHKEVITTPAVRHLARGLGVDINQVQGTGPGGRILENDVKAFAQKKVQPQGGGGPTAATKYSEVLEEQHSSAIERIPLSQTRKAIAKNVETSLSIPSFVHMDLINATYLYGVVKKEKPNLEKMGVKLTFLPYIIKAVVQGIKENPNVNSSYDPDRQEIILKKYYNIGLAAEAPDGLKVVVIKDADKKSIIQIAKEIQELHEKVEKQTITLDEMRDSTFTITNIGSLGGGFLSVPIINPPNVGILGVHLIRDMPVVLNGQVQIGKVLPFSLVFDHRVVDGAEVVKFGNALIKYLEDPDFLEVLG